MKKNILLILIFQFVINGIIQAQIHEAKMADEVVESIGINTHFYYTNTVYWTEFDTLKSLLIDLGIRHIRDGNAGQNSTYRERLNDLAGHGIKSLLICDTRFGLADNWSESLERLKLIMNQSNDPVELIEGPNEMDFSSSFSDLPSQMDSLWNTFKNDAETYWIPILGPSLGNTASSPMNLGDLSDFMDFGNIHSYSGGNPVEGSLGGGWGISLQEAIDRYADNVSGGLPAYATETGFQMLEDGHGNLQVTERAAAKYTPRAIIYYFEKGIKRFYHYQLINDNDDENFGLVNDDFSKREHYFAIKNLINLFEDPGNPFSTDSLEFNLSGDLDDIEYSLFQKRDGTHLLALWQSVNSCIPSNDEDNPPSDIEHSSESIILNFASDRSFNVNSYTPSFDSSSIDSWNNVNSLNIEIPDHLLVLEITDITTTSTNFNEPISESLSLFPNPFTFEINIEFDSQTEGELTISNQVGQIVYQSLIRNSVQIDTKNLAKGIYYLTVNNGENSWTRKIIKN